MKKEAIIKVLKKINDPELQIDIWTLGLIYEIKLEKNIVLIKMTFTSPMCPYGPYLIEEIKNKIKKTLKIKEVKVEVIFEPLWQPSEKLKNILGILD